MIGAGVRRDLFGAEPALGKDVKINDVWCEVIGVLAREPGARRRAVQGVAGRSTDHEIYLPFTTALRKLDRDPLKSPLGRDRRSGSTPDAPARETGAVIGTLLDRLHGGTRDFEIVVPEALLRHSRETQQLFNLVMGLHRRHLAARRRHRHHEHHARDRARADARDRRAPRGRGAPRATSASSSWSPRSRSR